MTTVIQSTSINNAANPAVSLGSGDLFYELPGVNISTTGADAISTTGTGYTAYIQGTVFGATVGLFAPSGATLSATITSTGSVFGGFYGIELLGTPPSSYIEVDGTLNGGAGGIVSTSASGDYVYVHVGATGTVSSVGTAISLVNNGTVQVDGTVSGQSGDGININGSGSVEVAVNAGGSVTTTATSFTSNAIDVNGTAQFFVAGTVSGGDAALMNFNQTAGVNSTVAVAGSGVLNGVGYGVYMTGQHVIANAGAINVGSGTVNSGIYISTNAGQSSSGTVANSGTISSGTWGIGIADTLSADNLVTVNTGTISGGAFSYHSTTPSLERVVNQGTMNGDVLLGSHAGSSFVNAGTLNGNVALGSGAGQLFDSTLGDISGAVTCGIGGDTVVGGQTGGSVTGGAGNDILMANATQGAADAFSHTTLDGGTGSNALYGGSGFTTFLAGDTSGGYNQIWGGASKVNGVPGFTNNVLSFSSSASGAFVDLLNGHDAYVAAPGNSWTGSGTYEDSIINVPNVIGSNFGDVIQADNGVDRITGGGGADQLYAGSGGGSQDTFVYTAYGDSNLDTGYDTIVGFKIGTDKIDLSAFHTDASHLALSNAGTSNTVYLEQTPGSFNANTDLAMVVNTTATGGLHASDFVF
jgi:hypothetical protein